MSRTGRSRVLALSTSSLGGAAIMLLAAALLGEKAPWFVSRLSVAREDAYSVSVAVDKVFQQRDAQQAMSSLAYRDDRLGFALERPATAWKITTEDPGRPLNGISIARVPYLNLSFAVMAPMMTPGSVLPGGVTTTTLRPQNEGTLVTYTEASAIDHILLTLNPARDREFVRAAVQAGTATLPITSTQGDDEGEGEDKEQPLTTPGDDEEFLTIAQEALTATIATVIKERWPKPETLTPSLTITTISREQVTRNPLFRVLLAKQQLSLSLALSFLTFSNPELATANVKHLEFSRKNDVALVNSSATLEDVGLNGKATQEVELVRIALLAITDKTIYVVTINYLHGVTSRGTGEALQKTLASFRVLV